MKLVFATNNIHKLSEIRDILGPGFELVTPADLGIHEDIPEEAPTLEGNALQKARYLWERTHGLPCFADDTGLEVSALDGAPGVWSARYAGEAKDDLANMRLLLANLDGQRDRRARFRTVIALVLLLWLASLHWTSMRSLELLFQPGMVPWFFVGAVGFGILVPLLAEVSYALMKKRVFLPFFCTLCLIGSLCLRYCIVSVGVY